MTPQALQEALVSSQGFMNRCSDKPLILGRLRSLKRLTSTTVLSKCAHMRGGTMQPIDFPRPRWAGATLCGLVARLLFKILQFFLILVHLIQEKYYF